MSRESFPITKETRCRVHCYLGQCRDTPGPEQLPAGSWIVWAAWYSGSQHLARVALERCYMGVELGELEEAILALLSERPGFGLNASLRELVSGWFFRLTKLECQDVWPCRLVLLKAIICTSSCINIDSWRVVRRKGEI